MEDDNSCLFRAVGYALLRNLDTMHELRSLVASAIQADPVQFSDAMLDRPRDQYVQWIQTPNAWGGAIEMFILASHFDVTICSMDVQSGRVDRFNPGRPTFVLVVYSGIHYDAVALTPASGAPAELDTTVFTDNYVGEMVLAAAADLAAALRQKHYYTNTNDGRFRCDDCGTVLHNEKDIAAHTRQTGHARLSECS
ncbi:OTU-domain-containing protein [Dipodascopsis tothii]|uniref:OTU-domain-containing protein n=1 Tax=Dipodascopsis tothii TaxID=44089 RepID=UPI0034CE9352